MGLAAVASLMVALGACAAPPTGPGAEHGGPAAPSKAAAAGRTAPPVQPSRSQPVGSPAGEARLIAYTNCTQMLQAVKTEALEEVGPYGLTGAAGAPGSPVVLGPGHMAGPVGLPAMSSPATPGPVAPAAAGDAASAGASSTTPAYSNTNDQEPGVDEPDLVKTNGQLMVILRQQPIGVQVVDVSSSPPQLDGFLPLSQLGVADGLFLVGQDAVVIGSVTSFVTPPPIPTGSSAPGANARRAPAGVSPGGPMVRAPEPGTTTNPGGPTVPAPLPGNVNPGGPMVPAPLPGNVNPGGPMVPARPAPAGQPAVVPVEGPVEHTDAVVVSLADPGAPSVVRTFSFQGELQGARLIDGQVVLALTSQPRLEWAEPVAPTPAAQKAATAANRALIKASTAADWLPGSSVLTVDGRTAASSGPACTRAYQPPVLAGLGTVSIASFDPTSNAPSSEVTVLGGAQDVYASATDIFVATTSWPFGRGRCPVAAGVVGGCCPVEAGVACPMSVAAPPASPGFAEQVGGSTTIYGFDISDPAQPHYLGSGQVPGTLIGPYAMSEYGGYLRVATTTGQPTPAPADGGQVPAQLSGNMVSVLGPEHGDLVTVGSLHGLGPGEKIYAVLFQGDLGYVVTFNQLDPLYVLDLSDPQHPALAGQVSMAGYSSTLQALGSGLLLGVGQSVDPGLQSQGLQLEVFNVANPDQPALVSRQALGAGASSSAEYDPHALLWWAPSDLLVLPVDDYASSSTTNAADAWTVGPAGALTALGTLAQPGSPEIERAVVVGGAIYTISETGVMASDLSSLAQVAWLRFAGAA